MKKTILIGLCSSLFMLGITSCEKEETKPTPVNTTTGNNNGGPTTNPLPSKLGKGSAILEMDGIKDTFTTQEFMLDLGPVKLFTVLHSNQSSSFEFITGDTSLPKASKTFTITNDIDAKPMPGQVILSWYNPITESDFIAQSGTVTYTIGTQEKVIRFSNIQFKEDLGTATKTLNYEAKLK